MWDETRRKKKTKAGKKKAEKLRHQFYFFGKLTSLILGWSSWRIDRSHYNCWILIGILEIKSHFVRLSFPSRSTKTGRGRRLRRNSFIIIFKQKHPAHSIEKNSCISHLKLKKARKIIDFSFKNFHTKNKIKK